MSSHELVPVKFAAYERTDYSKIDGAEQFDVKVECLNLIQLGLDVGDACIGLFSGSRLLDHTEFVTSLDPVFERRLKFFVSSADPIEKLQFKLFYAKGAEHIQDSDMVGLVELSWADFLKAAKSSSASFVFGNPSSGPTNKKLQKKRSTLMIKIHEMSKAEREQRPDNAGAEASGPSAEENEQRLLAVKQFYFLSPSGVKQSIGNHRVLPSRHERHYHLFALSAERLLKMDWQSLSDPIGALYDKSTGSLIDTTEFLLNNQDPVFNRPLKVLLQDQDNRMFRLAIYDVNSSVVEESNLIGDTTIPAEKLVEIAQTKQPLVLPLSNPDLDLDGRLTEKRTIIRLRVLHVPSAEDREKAQAELKMLEAARIKAEKFKAEREEKMKLKELEKQKQKDEETAKANAAKEEVKQTETAAAPVAETPVAEEPAPVPVPAPAAAPVAEPVSEPVVEKQIEPEPQAVEEPVKAAETPAPAAAEPEALAADLEKVKVSESKPVEEPAAAQAAAAEVPAAAEPEPASVPEPAKAEPASEPASDSTVFSAASLPAPVSSPESYPAPSVDEAPSAPILTSIAPTMSDQAAQQLVHSEVDQLAPSAAPAPAPAAVSASSSASSAAPSSPAPKPTPSVSSTPASPSSEAMFTAIRETIRKRRAAEETQVSTRGEDYEFTLSVTGLERTGAWTSLIALYEKSEAGKPFKVVDHSDPQKDTAITGDAVFKKRVTVDYRSAEQELKFNVFNMTGRDRILDDDLIATGTVKFSALIQNLQSGSMDVQESKLLLRHPSNKALDKRLQNRGSYILIKATKLASKSNPLASPSAASKLMKVLDVEHKAGETAAKPAEAQQPAAKASEPEAKTESAKPEQENAAEADEEGEESAQPSNAGGKKKKKKKGKK